MNPFDAIEKLITEHGSAAILRERIVQAKERHIVIQLTMECLTDQVRACYQLAHESVHLLAPTGGRNANVLEEGLATYFSELYLHDTFATSMPPELASYADSCSRVRQLL